MPIADTVIVEKGIVRYVYTDTNGNVVKAKPKSETTRSKEKFVIETVNRFLAPSRNEPHLANKPGTLNRRVAAVLKKPFWRSSVANDTEVLLPLPLTAHLLDAVDGKAGPHVLQRFVWCRGRRACQYRVFWKAARGHTAKAMVVWNISSTENFLEFSGSSKEAADIKEDNE